jgi:hypothetical protein
MSLSYGNITLPAGFFSEIVRSAWCVVKGFLLRATHYLMK